LHQQPFSNQNTLKMFLLAVEEEALMIRARFCKSAANDGAPLLSPLFARLGQA
jgi:hypothetical protein